MVDDERWMGERLCRPPRQAKSSRPIRTQARGRDGHALDLPPQQPQRDEHVRHLLPNLTHRATRPETLLTPISRMQGGQTPTF